jgi:hypothetical protein
MGGRGQRRRRHVRVELDELVNQRTDHVVPPRIGGTTLARLAKHTIEIRPLGDGRVEIDAFIVLR